MSKNDLIRLRHLIPKKTFHTDYEKQEYLLSKNSNNPIDNHTKHCNIKENSSYNNIQYSVLKTFKKPAINKDSPNMKRKAQLNYKEDYKSSNKNLKNYMDHIYMEKKGKFKLQSSEHPWVNDD